MNWLLLLTFLVSIAEITSFIEEALSQYFNSDVVKECTELWRQHTFSVQNAISLAMQDTFGYRGMNVYIKRPRDPLLVSKGYYHTDNQVQLILKDLTLEEFPHISDPKISFPLLSNVLKLEARVSKMRLHAHYILFRNTSKIVYNSRDQNPYETSPFLFEQVRTTGQVAITVERCKISGIGITSLTGRTVSLGNMVFRLYYCEYSFEIFSPGLGSPPVIANYLPNSEGFHIEQLLMRPLESELMPKLQGALHTIVNTSAIFLDKLAALRFQQQFVFKLTTNYVNNVIRNMNILTIARDHGKEPIDDFVIHWNDTFGESPAESTIKLHSMVLTGMETVYTSHSGGPFRLSTVKISEEMRFGTLQVRGTFDMQIGDKTKVMNDFAAEINDVEVDVTYNIYLQRNSTTKDKSFAKALHVVEVMGWRSLQFSSLGLAFVPGEALITGYLLTKVPVILTKHFNDAINESAKEADKEYEAFPDKKLLHSFKCTGGSNCQFKIRG